MYEVRYSGYYDIGSCESEIRASQVYANLLVFLSLAVSRRQPCVPRLTAIHKRQFSVVFPSPFDFCVSPPAIYYYTSFVGDTRHYATSLKVAGSNPDEVNFFQLT
jgi:hypothetical protein